jgi:cathepsin A (carboxypeptidase C)
MTCVDDEKDTKLETVQMEKVEGMPDMTCLMNMDPNECTSALDATNVGCSWCESSVFPKLHGCLSQMEATEIMDLITQAGEDSEIGLSCRHSKDDYVAVEDKAAVDMQCMIVSTEEGCISTSDSTGTPCEWCATVNPAMSMLDMCMSIPDAAMLPKTLYACGSSGADPVEEKIVVREEKEIVDEMPSREFSFVEGMKHTLRSDTVDSHFCDPKSPKSISGYMDITGSKGEEEHLYFWMFEKRTKKSLRTPDINPHTLEDNTPIILWLTGGPGCSSTLALLSENGPCSVDSEGLKTIPNAYSWNEAAHIIFLDQPAGVGFSYADKEDTKDETMVGNDVYYFLQGFYQMHSKYRKNPVFVVGESYGGHYAPAVAHRIMTGNKHLKDECIHINLKGLAVGNGMTDPKVQYKYYADMAYNNSHKIKTVPKAVYTAMKKATPTCISMMNTCTSSPISSKFTCQVAENYCNMALIAPFTATGLNMYDIRSKCTNGDLCYDFDNIVKFMNLPSTRKALHVSDASSKWATCNMHVHDQFTVDAMKDMSSNVIDLLDNDIATLIYAGDTDFICNYLGNKAWTDELKWKHHKEYKHSEPYDWKKQGMAKSYKGLTFLQVYDAGHMVPHDQPKVALEMIHDFVKRYS